MSSSNSDTDKEDSGLGNRPLSELLVDLHVYRIPNEFWVPERRLAKNQATDFSISAGFIRILAELTLQDIRKEIAHQLGYDTLPKDFIFLRSIGRNYAKVRPRQEQHLKAKIFMPPLALEPELYLLENPDIFLQSSLELLKLGVVKEATYGLKHGESRRKSKRLSRARASSSYSTNTTATRFPTVLRATTTTTTTTTTSQSGIAYVMRPRVEQQQQQSRSTKLPEVMGVVATNNCGWNEDDEDEGVEDDEGNDEEGQERVDESSRSSGYADSATTADKTPTTPMHMLQLPPLMLLPDDIAAPTFPSSTIAIIQATDTNAAVKTTANRNKKTLAMSIMPLDTYTRLPDMEKETKEEEEDQRTNFDAIQDKKCRHSETEEGVVQKRNMELKDKDEHIKTDGSGKKTKVQKLLVDTDSEGIHGEVAFRKEKWTQLGGKDANEVSPATTEERHRQLDRTSTTQRVQKDGGQDMQTGRKNYVTYKSNETASKDDAKREMRIDRKFARRKGNDVLLAVPAKNKDIDQKSLAMQSSADQVTRNHNRGEIDETDKSKFENEIKEKQQVETDEQMEIRNMLRRRRVTKKPKYVKPKRDEEQEMPHTVRHATPRIKVSEHMAERIREPQKKMDKKITDEEKEAKTRQSKESMSVVREEKEEDEEGEEAGNNNAIINDEETINKVSNDREEQLDLRSNRKQQTISSQESVRTVKSRIPKPLHRLLTTSKTKRHGQSNKIISMGDQSSIKETDKVSERNKKEVSKKFDTSGRTGVHITDKINKRQKHWKLRSRSEREVAIDDEDDSHKTGKSNRNFKRIRRGTKKRDEHARAKDKVNVQHQDAKARPPLAENGESIVDGHTKSANKNSEKVDTIKSRKDAGVSDADLKAKRSVPVAILQRRESPDEGCDPKINIGNKRNAVEEEVASAMEIHVEQPQLANDRGNVEQPLGEMLDREDSSPSNITKRHQIAEKKMTQATVVRKQQTADMSQFHQEVTTSNDHETTNGRVKKIANESDAIEQMSTKLVWRREKSRMPVSHIPKRNVQRRRLDPMEHTQITLDERKQLHSRVPNVHVSKGEQISTTKAIQSEQHLTLGEKGKVGDGVNIGRKSVQRDMSTVGTEGHPLPRVTQKTEVATTTRVIEAQHRRHILLTYSREILPTWLMTSKDRCNFLTYLLVHPEEYNDLTRRQLMGLLRTLRWQRRRARKLQGDYQRYLHYLSENRHGGKYKHIGAEAADMWKRKYLEELRDTHILKEQIRRLRQHLQVLRQQTTPTTSGDGQQVNNVMIEPSNEASYKTSATKLIREIEELRREVDTAKVKLATESKLRNQVENEAKLLRTEAVDRKINAALSRTQVPPHPPLAASSWIPPYLFRLAI